MLTADFDYHLPSELIAQRPRARGASKLLVLRRSGDIEHRRIADLPALLRPNDLVVVNDTKVIPARLSAARRPGGGQSEIFLVERLDGRSWKVLIRPARRSRPGSILELEGGITASVVSRDLTAQNISIVEFSEHIEPWLERIGHTPLPPYIDRPDDEDDRDRYQTIFAAEDGAVAAPTAGLHFDNDLVAALERHGIDLSPITLHVGLGTFRPISVERTENHQMDEERYAIPEATAERIKTSLESGGRIVAVGTTSVRTLESAARRRPSGFGNVVAGSGRTDLFITPGFRFRVVDLMLTNFHLPRSTLLMLVSAFAGRQQILGAYRSAIEDGYRFYSYGDAMLIENYQSHRPSHDSNSDSTGSLDR